MTKIYKAMNCNGRSVNGIWSLAPKEKPPGRDRMPTEAWWYVEDLSEYNSQNK